MLKGKWALVTGATAGLGLAVAESLAGAGANIVLHDLAEPEGARDRLRSRFGIEAESVAADLSQRSAIETLMADLLGRLGAVDILVNNAGVAHLPQPLEGLTEDSFDRILAVNVKAIYLAARHVVPRFKAKKSGVILNIASTAGVSPRPNLTWYNASKGWVITATRSMAVELAPFGLRVNALNPVAGETPLLKTFLGEDTPERRAKFLATIPLGRFSTPQDMGNAATFLCSDAASMITGVALEVDGGRCI